MAKRTTMRGNQSTNNRNISPRSLRMNVLASCYAVDSLTTTLHGFHYSSTLAGGKHSRYLGFLTVQLITFDPQGQSGIPEVSSGKVKSTSTRSPSPPLFTLFAEAESARSGRDRRLRREEATQTITEECERLFCDALRGIFLVESEISDKGALVIGASNSKRISTLQEDREQRHILLGLVEVWVEVWDYGSDAFFRGFVAGKGEQKALFVFFEQDVVEKDLKSGLISLMELAPNFNCTQLVACLDRTIEPVELEKIVRNFGWVGFNLSTLDAWMANIPISGVVSDHWLFLNVEV